MSYTQIDTLKNGKTIIQKRLIDRFYRNIFILMVDHKLVDIRVNNFPLFSGFSFNPQKETVYITSEIFTGQPKWWQFWRKKVDPLVAIPI